jgi:hypothetical protein
VTTTTTEIVVDVPLVERPTTTTAPTPEVPSSSVDLYTATSVEKAGEAGNAGPLPRTGWGAGIAYLGAGLIALGLAFWPVRRRLARENAR